MKRGYSFVDTTSLPTANSLDHHAAQLLNMSAMIKQFSEQMEFMRSSIEIQQHHLSGRWMEPVQESTDIALQNTLSIAEPATAYTRVRRNNSVAERALSFKFFFN